MYPFGTGAFLGEQTVIAFSHSLPSYCEQGLSGHTFLSLVYWKTVIHISWPPTLSFYEQRSVKSQITELTAQSLAIFLLINAVLLLHISHPLGETMFLSPYFSHTPLDLFLKDVSSALVKEKNLLKYTN